MGRNRKDCPMTGCNAKGLIKLSNHLTQVHGTGPNRKKALDIRDEENVEPQSVSPQKSVESATTDWHMRSLIPFQPNSTFWISGATASGKSSFIFRFLKNLNGLYAGDPPQKVMYCYGTFQHLYVEMEATVPDVTLHQGLPSISDIDDFCDGRHHSLIVLDDLMSECMDSQTTELIATQFCHHKRISCFVVTQNLMPKGKHARTIALNSQYLILFQNLRDRSQITHLGRQLFPGKKGFLTEAYQDCMKQKIYNYLVVDLAPQTQEKYRVRSNVFPGEHPIVYIPKMS
jgi:hypothetical protein